MAKEISAAFPFESKYVEVEGSKMHYVEEGEGTPILFIHGNPTSAYLWRNIIPYAAKHGRAIAVDLIGMGKSDKPDIAYRFGDHARYVDGFIGALGLENIVLVIHDWGSGLGFHYARRHEDNVRAIAFMEAIVRPMSWAEFPTGFKIGFKLFRAPVTGYVMNQLLNTFITRLLPNATLRKFTDEEMRHYAEPYPTTESRRPLAQWPKEIPIDGSPADVHDAVTKYSEWLCETKLPKIFFRAEPGGIIPAKLAKWVEENFLNLETVDIGKGIHYVQEDNPHAIGEGLATWLQKL